MGQKKFNYLFAVASLLLLFGQSPSAEARQFIGVNPWCRTAFHRRLCTRMVNGAVTQNEASMNALKTALEYANRLQGMVEMVKPAIADLDVKTQESIMATCTEDFEGNVDDLQKSIAAMQVNDLGTVLARLSAALHDDCEMALTERRIKSPVAKYAKLMSKEVDNCLAVIMQN